MYELVNWSNNVPKSNKSKDQLIQDEDGLEAVKFLRKVENAVGLITGNEPESLGLHPIVYFYTIRGEFQPSAFIATASFLRSLSEKKLLPTFVRVRARLEDFLIHHKEFITLVVKITGTKGRSHGRSVRYLEKLISEFSNNKTSEEVLLSIREDAEFSELCRRMGDDGLRRAAYRGGWKPA